MRFKQLRLTAFLMAALAAMTFIAPAAFAESNSDTVIFDISTQKASQFANFGRIPAPEGDPNVPDPNTVFTVTIICSPVYIELNPMPCGEVRVHLYYKEAQTGRDGKATLLARVTRVNGGLGSFTITASRSITLKSSR